MMNAPSTPVPVANPGDDPGEPLRPGPSGVTTRWPWDSPFAWAFPPPRGKRHRRRTGKRKRPGDYETGCVGGRWFAVSLRGGPVLMAATEQELEALILASRGAR
jgi:hypothetical protein